MPRLIFANQLRGLAAMFVAGSHLVGAYWAMRDFVSLATAAPVQSGEPPALFGLFSHTWLNFGPLGVGVFFLISGLVIPISLEKHTRGTFLVARLLRIYPTYVVALLLEMAVVQAAAAYWGKPFPYDGWTIFSNALLIYNTVRVPSIDLVNWTLCVELKFYLLMLAFAPQIRRGSVVTILAVGAAILVANYVVAWPAIAVRITRTDLVETFSTESVFVIFMLLGVLFNFHMRGLLRLPGFVAAATAMAAMFVLCWTQSSIRAQVPIVTANYFYAIGIFAALYAIRRHARPIRILDFLASISFPLYLVHSLVGYSVLKLLMVRGGVAYLPALAIAVTLIVCLAYVLHITVESATVRLGKRLSRAPHDCELAKASSRHSLPV